MPCRSAYVPETSGRSVSGTYADRQGTEKVYSDLTLSRKDDGTYSVSMGLYKLAALEGTAEYEDGTLHFVCSAPPVEGDISVEGGEAVFTVTASDFPHLPVGEVYRFADGEVPRP